MEPAQWCSRCQMAYFSGGSECPVCRNPWSELAGPSSSGPLTDPGKTLRTRGTCGFEGLTTAAPELPKMLGDRFQTVEFLGRGGGGSVFLVRDVRLDRQVAIKLLHGTGIDELLDFEAEGKLLASLENEHVVRLYDAGIIDGIPHLVMEYVRGITLCARLAQGRPNHLEAARIALDIAKGIQAAHARNIVHRDLKPANVFLDVSGKAKIADFGLAIVRERVDASAEDSPHGHDTAGTLGYMAPEQARGDRVGPPADIYAWGIIFYEMLAGRRLFAGNDPVAILKVQQQGKPRYPSQVNPAVPQELDELVFQALSADPDQRPTAPVLVARLGDWFERTTRGRSQGAAAHPARPYKPLRHLDAEDSPLFFGRDAEVQELVSTLKSPATRVVFLFGPCGIGKSSLLRAGLVPALDAQSHEVAILTSGPDPARALWQLVSDKLHLKAENGDAQLAPRLHRLSALVRDWTQWVDKTVVLVIDQLEELVTHNPRGTPRIGAFFEAIQSLVEDTRLPVKIVLSFRTEFRGEFFPLEERLAVYQRSYGIREITEAGLAEAIEGPSRIAAYGFGFADGFPRRLASDILGVTATSGDTALPVMQIVASQLLDRAREKGILTIGPSLYEGAWGGAEGALQRYVEDRLESVEYAHYGAMARQMLAALTIREPGGERFSLACDEEDLLNFPDRSAARRTLERLVTDHLVIREVALDSSRTIRLASEIVCGLIDAWAMEPDEGERAARTLARTYRNWEEHGRRAEDLLAGAALDLVRGQRGNLRDVPPPESAFLAASLARRRASRIGWSAALTVVLLALGSLGYAAFLRPGALQLSSSPPGASVQLEGRSIGTTPLRLEARPGVYHLVLGLPRHLTTSMTVQVPAGGEAVYHQVLAYPFGQLAVNSTPPGAVCEVVEAKGGSPRTAGAAAAVLRRTTPFSAEVPAGDYRLLLSKPGYGSLAVEHVQVHPNRELSQRSVVLESTRGWLAVQGGVPGSRLRVVDARSAARVFEGTLPLKVPCELPAGSYRLECSLPDHVTDRQVVEISRGATTTMRVWTQAVTFMSFGSLGSGFAAPPAAVRLGAHEWLDLVGVSTEGEVVAVSARSRETLWRFPGKSEGRARGALAAAPALADVNDDGLSDLVVACRDGRVRALDGRTGSVLWTFDPRAPIAAPPVAAGLDTGGRPAVVVACRGPGSASSLRIVSGPTGSVLWTCDLGEGVTAAPAVGDVDGDGIPDLVAGTEAGAVRVIGGRTRSSLWAARVEGAVTTPPILADLDGDGVLDVVVATANGRVHALGGRSGVVIWKITASDSSPSVMDAGDVDGDGIPDVALTTVKGRVMVVGGKTGGLVWRTSPIASGATAPALGDLDGDSLADVVVGTRGGELVALSGRDGASLWTRQAGGPVLAAPTLVDLGRSGMPVVVAGSERGTLALVAAQGPRPVWATQPGGDLAVPPSVADLNKDGVPDAVVPAGRQLSAVGGKTGALLWRFEASSVFTTTASLGDLDRDGVDDVVAGTQFGAVHAVSGRSGLPLWEFDTKGIMGSCPVLADLDTDGVLEVCVGSIDGQVHALSGRDGRVRWSVPIGERVLASPVVADLDGDGHLWIVVSSIDGWLQALDGRTGRMRWKCPIAPNTVSTAAIGDLDGDGLPDVVVGSGAGTIRAVAGRAGKPLWSVEAGGKMDSSPGLADLDGDGKLEVVALASDGLVYVLAGATGRRIFVLDLQGGSLATAPELVDLDGDGLPDILAAAFDGSTTALSGTSGRLIGRYPAAWRCPFPPVVLDRPPREGARSSTWLDRRYGIPAGPGRRAAGLTYWLGVHDHTTLFLVGRRWPVDAGAAARVATPRVARGQPLTRELQLEQAVLASPKSAGARLDLARHLQRIGRPQEAMVRFREALVLDPVLAGAGEGLEATLPARRVPSALRAPVPSPSPAGSPAR